jgi:hypothetical protein
MKIFSRTAFIGALVSGILLAGHALYFGAMSIALADALVFLLIVACWVYLLKQTGGSHETSAHPDASASGDHRFIQESSAFHVQLGNEMSDQLTSAHTELGNTQAILSDAIVKLVSNFIAISDGVRELSQHTGSFSKQVHQLIEDVRSTLASSEQFADNGAAGETNPVTKSNRHVQAMMGQLVAFNDTVAQNALELNAINSKVEQNVLVVISTLQFQDMSSQLIEHARMRMAALKEIANEMGRGGDSTSQREYMDQIAAYNRLLQKHVASLDKQKSNPVAQKDFGTGDIELF